MPVPTASKARIRTALKKVFGNTKQYESRIERVLEELFPPSKSKVKK